VFYGNERQKESESQTLLGKISKKHGNAIKQKQIYFSQIISSNVTIRWCLDINTKI